MLGDDLKSIIMNSSNSFKSLNEGMFQVIEDEILDNGSVTNE